MNPENTGRLNSSRRDHLGYPLPRIGRSGVSGARSRAWSLTSGDPWLGMIPNVPPRLLSLMFSHVLGLVLLMGRTSATKDVELLVSGTR
jgi:hypothetical protein